MEILRAEYLDYMKCRSVRRPLFVELFGPLIGLDHEWQMQGAHADELNLTRYGFDWVRRHEINVATGLFPGFTESVIERSSEHEIRLDRYGRLSKLCLSRATIPLPMEFPVRDMSSWLAIKPGYAYSARRFGKGWLENARRAFDEGALIVLGVPGGFDELRELMGDELTCLSYYTQPELIHDMLETMVAMVERIVDETTRAVPVQQISIHEDLAGKNGPLIGPNIVDEFMRPYYRRIWDLAASRGAELFQMDSDGNIGPVLEAFISSGVNSFLPLEPAAGMDMVALKKNYAASIALVGGIDKFSLLGDRPAIRAELEYKLQPCMRQGGVLFGLDHRIPNGVALENYRYYVKTAREMLGLASSPEPGWARMAF